MAAGVRARAPSGTAGLPVVWPVRAHSGSLLCEQAGSRLACTESVKIRGRLEAPGICELQTFLFGSKPFFLKMKTLRPKQLPKVRSLSSSDGKTRTLAPTLSGTMPGPRPRACRKSILSLLESTEVGLSARTSLREQSQVRIAGAFNQGLGPPPTSRRATKAP